MGRESLVKSVQLLWNSNLEEQARQKKDKLPRDKIDVTDLMIKFLEKKVEQNG